MYGNTLSSSDGIHSSPECFCLIINCNDVNKSSASPISASPLQSNLSKESPGARRSSVLLPHTPPTAINSSVGHNTSEKIEFWKGWRHTFLDCPFHHWISFCAFHRRESDLPFRNKAKGRFQSSSFEHHSPEMAVNPVWFCDVGQDDSLSEQ